MYGTETKHTHCKTFGCWLILYLSDSFSVPANFRSLVYFYGIKNGGVKEWDFAFEQFQKTTIASERRKILYGLSGASEPWILSRYKTQFGIIDCLRQPKKTKIDTA